MNRQKWYRCLEIIMACILSGNSINVIASSADLYDTRQDSDNTYNTATSITVNKVPAQNHTIHAISDEDWLQFDAQAGNDYQIIVDNVGSDIDIALELYDIDGNTRLDRQNLNFEGQGETIRFSAPEKETYYVRVTHTGFFVDNTQYQIRVIQPQLEVYDENGIAIDEMTVIPEGDSKLFTIVLSAPTTETVTVTITDAPTTSVQDNDITLIPTSFNLTPDNDYKQVVTLSATQDDDAKTGQKVFLVKAKDSDLNEVKITAQEQDNTPLKLELESTADIAVEKMPEQENEFKIVVEEGQTGQEFKVKLSAIPDNNFTVTITADTTVQDEHIQLTPSDTFDLVSPNYETTLTLNTTLDDDIQPGQQIFVFKAQNSETGSQLETVTLTVQEQDTTQLTLKVEPTEISVKENGTAEFTVALSAKPIDDVNIMITQLDDTQDPNIKIEPETDNKFTLTAANQFRKTINLSAEKDADMKNGKATFQVTATGSELLTEKTKQVTATEIDNWPIPTLTLDMPERVNVLEGKQQQFTVKLSPIPSEDVNVTVTISEVSDVSSGQQQDNDIQLETEGRFALQSDNNYEQFVTLSAAIDEDDKNGQKVFTVSGVVNDSDITLDTMEVTAVEQDNDIPLKLKVESNEVFVSEGDTTQFMVTLSGIPESDVVEVTIQPDPNNQNENITLSPQSEPFELNLDNNYQQTITVVHTNTATDQMEPKDKAVFKLIADSLDSTDDVTVNVLPRLGTSWMINKDNENVSNANAIFSGGISVNNSGFQHNTIINTTDDVSIQGLIKFDPDHISQKADILVVLKYEYLVLTEQKEILKQESFIMLTSDSDEEWMDGKIASLKPFKKLTLSGEILPVDNIFNGKLNPGILSVWFGYRLEDGATIYNEQHIEIKVKVSSPFSNRLD